MAKSIRPTSRRIFWDRAITRQARSGLTQAEFCARHALSLHVFRSRKYTSDPARRLPGHSAPALATAPPFLPVRLVTTARPVDSAPEVGAAAVHTPALELVLDRGCVIRIPPNFEASSLQRVIALLEGGAC